MNKIVKILLWIVGVVVALLALVSLLGGPVAKGYVNGHGEQLTGRRVKIDHVGLNLFTGRVNVRGFNLYEEDGERTFATFDTLDIRARLLPLIGKHADIRRLTLAGLDVNVEQNDTVFNFSSMLDHFKGDEEKEKDTTPSDWVLRLGDLRLNHAKASYRDLQRNKDWHIADMNLRVPGFVIGGEENTQAGLNIELEDGGRLNLNTDFDAKSNNFSADVTLGGFALSNIKEYLTDKLNIDKLEGTLDAHLTAKGNLSEAMKSRLGGEVELSAVDITDGRHNPVASINRLAVEMKEINLDEKRFDIGSITLDGLTAIYEQWEDASTMTILLNQETTSVAEKADTNADMVDEEMENIDTTAVAPAEKKGLPIHLTVDMLKVSNCAITYNNHTLPEEFHLPITNLNIDAQNISTTGRNNARLRASLPGGGTLAVRWMGNLDNIKSYQDLLLIVKGLDMRQLSPWTLYYTGQPVEDGIFGLSSHNTIVDGVIDGKNSIDIYKATIGDHRKGVKAKQKLPLKAALYVLKDKDDKIQIDLPITGNVNDPEFSYMKTVWKTLGNLLVKVATSPVRAIAGAMGLSGENMDFLPIDPEQHGLTSEQYHTLGELARVTISDTMVVLGMELHMDDTLRSARLNEHVHQYMLELGVPENQLNITTGEADGRSGYTISSELKVEN